MTGIVTAASNINGLRRPILSLHRSERLPHSMPAATSTISDKDMIRLA